MNSKLEKLNAEQAQNEKKLEQLQHQQQLLENRVRYLHKVERKAHKLREPGLRELLGDY